MKKIGVKEVREILLEVLCGYSGLCESIVRTPDEKFLKINLQDEYGLSSLDIEDMFDTLYELYGITVDVHNPLAEYSFNKERTVENFIDTVNYCLSRNM